MKTRVAVIAAIAVSLAACQQAPADGTADEPATENEAPLEPSVPDEEPDLEAEPAAPEAAGAPKLGYAGPIPMPIKIGTNGSDMDSCASYGEVSGLDPEGDNYLSVRDAPSTEVKERDRLDAGQGVHVCAESNGWYGVVYDKADAARDCGTDSPVPTPRNYTGPCAQGWVSSKFVTIVAG
ncbi:MAG: hypothetical protein CL808_08045 [Citromicrobium sp.]|nr:hypothetical protein [Citromicrobium sp.]